MQGRPVNELLDVPVERPTVDQLKIEVGRRGMRRSSSALRDGKFSRAVWD
jgi:hypothetical protein